MDARQVGLGIDERAVVVAVEACEALATGASGQHEVQVAVAVEVAPGRAAALHGGSPAPMSTNAPPSLR